MEWSEQDGGWKLGKRVGLANKETLVASGKLIIEAMRTSGTELLPVDSEHNGAHQAFRAGRRDEVAKLMPHPGLSEKAVV